MSLFDNLGKKLGDAAQNAVKKSGEMVEITKINLSIKSEEDSLSKIYSEIGKYSFDKFENGNENDSKIIDLCEKIRSHMVSIDAYKEKINQIRNVKICENCGSETLRTNAFCGKCGAKIENDDKQELNNNEEKDLLCPNCNMKIEGDSSFCPSCGTQV